MSPICARACPSGVGERDRVLSGSVRALIGDHRWIRPRDVHPERAAGQPSNQAWHLPGQLLCRRLLPDADDDEGKHGAPRSPKTNRSRRTLKLPEIDHDRG
jgi:hypothetical protein